MGEEKHLKSVDTASMHEIKTDAMIAQELKDAVRPLLDQQCVLMDKARGNGMQLNWAVTTNSFGKHVITEVIVTKQI